MIRHFEKIEKLVESFDKPTKDFLSKIEVERCFKKGDILLPQGNICRRSFHIVSGIARKYYLKDGKEITTEFYFEDDLAVAFSSYTFQQPSKEFIDCLTDVHAKITQYQDWELAKRKFPHLIELDLLLTEIHAGFLETHIRNIRTLSATQRYENLLKQAPYLLKYINLTHIASYLGVKPESLSRIRRRMAQS